jgi:predicted alpha/beta hydrolase family esterase
MIESKYSSLKAEEVVMLFHGACKTSKQMSYIESSLHKLGYRTCNINYSWRYQESAKIVEEMLWQVKRIEMRYNKVHFIGHSLGGLIIRGVLTQYKPKNLGKVIHIASPNQGSKLASQFKSRWLYKKAYGKVSQDLIVNSKFLKMLETDIEYELGTIAGNSSNLLVNCLLKFERNDGRVTESEAILEGAKDHIVINANHNQVVKSACALHQIRMFLLNGKFDHDVKNRKKW